MKSWSYVGRRFDPTAFVLRSRWTIRIILELRNSQKRCQSYGIDPHGFLQKSNGTFYDDRRSQTCKDSMWEPKRRLWFPGETLWEGTNALKVIICGYVIVPWMLEENPCGCETSLETAWLLWDSSQRRMTENWDVSLWRALLLNGIFVCRYAAWVAHQGPSQWGVTRSLLLWTIGR